MLIKFRPSHKSHDLTSREYQILKLIAQEKSTKDIGATLGIAIGTVESHRRNLFSKLGASNMAGAIHRAYQMGILTVGDF